MRLCITKVKRKLWQNRSIAAVSINEYTNLKRKYKKKDFGLIFYLKDDVNFKTIIKKLSTVISFNLPMNRNALFVYDFTCATNMYNSHLKI